VATEGTETVKIEAESEEPKKLNKRSIEAKWGKRLSRQFTAIPTEFLERYTELGLGIGEAMLLIQLARFWWDEPNKPYPGLKWIGESMGASYSQVRRYVAKCIAQECLAVKHRRGKTSMYDLSPLRTSLEALPKKPKRTLTPSWLAPDKAIK
jgi:hypothetical protein